METTKRVETHQINKSHELFIFCDRKCLESKNLYNKVNYILRQQFTESKGYKKENFDCNYYSLTKKYRKIDEAKIMGSNFTEGILKVLSQDWKSFFKSIKGWRENPDKYKGKPNLPGYAPTEDKGRKVAIDRKINRRKDGTFKFQKEKVYFEPQTDCKLKQARIVPSHNLAKRITHYKIEIVYEKEIPETVDKVERVVGIDLNVSRLAAVANNIEIKPFVINGNPVKSMNQYYNKKRAKLMEYVDGRGTSNRIRKLTKKRNNKIKTYFHKASRYIADWCNDHNIDTIIIGKNKDWKNEVDMGKTNNQNFVSIPFQMLINQIEYKAKEYGIKTITTEESYTSQASFLDRDKLPEYEKESNKKDYSFSGKRNKRGLYVAKDGTKINADINAAYNIIRKQFSGLLENKENHLHPKMVNLD